MIRCVNISVLLISFTATMVMASGDPITISGNTIGDLVNVNVNVTANIQNAINQDYINMLGLLLSSTGDVDLFRKLGKDTDATPTTTDSSTSIEKDGPSQQHEAVNIEEALKKLFPKLVNKQ
uniref:Uncharacterized protein n=1 Tax=Anopheles maculatus TaxID=74869 RepID=A0A182SZ21_9DIPT